MRTALATVFGTMALVACGQQPAPTVPATTTSAAALPSTGATAPPASTLPATTAGAPVEAPKPPALAADVTGKWCGAKVRDAVSCQAKDAPYVELDSLLGASLAGAGQVLGGQICEGYDHDCLPLETSTFSGNTLILFGRIKRAGSSKPDSFKGTFKLGADDVLVGTIVSTETKDPVQKSLYRIKER